MCSQSLKEHLWGDNGDKIRRNRKGGEKFMCWTSSHSIKVQTSPSKSFSVPLPFACWTPEPVSPTSRSRNRKDIIAAAGNTAATLKTPIFTETADTSTIPNSKGNCEEDIRNNSVMDDVLRIDELSCGEFLKVLLIYLIIHLWYDHCVDTSVPQQQQQAHAKSLSVCERAWTGAAVHRHPDVVVGQIVTHLER